MVDEVGQFRERADREQLFIPDALADCRQGSGDDTIKELIIEFDPDRDWVQTAGGPSGGTLLERA